MTWADLYVVVTVCAAIVSVAAAVGFSIDRWPEWSARALEHQRIARFVFAAHRGLAARRRGTVQNPTDPSPRPRNTPPIQSA